MLSGANLQAPPERRAILVDDLQVLGFDLKYRDSMCSQLLRQANLVILLSTDHWGFDDIQAAQRSLETLWSFARLKILEMGYVKRTELIGKWCRLSSPYTSETNDAWNRRTRIEKYVDGVIQNSLLPSYPGNVLMLVSLLEAGGVTENRTSAILYEAMVTRNLEAVVGSGADINTMYEYLAVFAYRLYRQNVRDVDLQEFSEWHRDYCKQYALDMDNDRTRRRACDAQLLREVHGRVGFRYPYAFFYFVARALSRQLGNEQHRELIRGLSRNLHREDAANIMLFLCYLSTDEFILDTIAAAAEARFSSQKEFAIDSLRGGVFASIGPLPPSVLPCGTTEETRLDVRAEQDQLAESRAEQDPDNEMLHDLHASFKTVQLLGEVLRNYPGSIVAPRKRQLAEYAYGLSLRTIEWWFELVEQHRDDLIRVLAHALLRRQSKELDPQRQPTTSEESTDATLRRVQRWLFGLSSAWTAWMIRQLTGAIGADVLSPTFREIATDHAGERASYEVIDLSIKLDLKSRVSET